MIKMKHILMQHFNSTRFVIVFIAIMISFISAVIKTIFTGFPFTILIGFLNGAAVVTYITKTLEPGAKERRNRNAP